jgi:GNAT superfamily N-acetyltransferase
MIRDGSTSRPSDLADLWRLRPVRASDLDAIAAMQEISIMALGAPVYGEDKARAWARLGYQFRYDLLGEGAFWVAEQEERIIGVGGWSPDSSEADLAWIRYLFVHPDATRRGIARQLVACAERSAGAAGRPRLRVWSSLNATGFYRAVGFMPERRARWPVRTGIELDYVLMGKRAEEGTPAREEPTPG